MRGSPRRSRSPDSNCCEALKTLFRWVSEEVPGDHWADLFRRAWPAYRRWFESEGGDARPDLEASEHALRKHLPELVPMWERLAELAEGEGGGARAARMLSLYRPARYLTGCSQAVWSRDAPFLVRNYDYHPLACEGFILRSRWHDTEVLASSDCLWGALDGMNEHGLAVALSFGGSREVGEGFGIPIILRYVLEFCSDMGEALEVLERVPSHMAYNVSVLDRSGAFAVVELGPDRPARVVPEPVCTNHQDPIEWEAYASRSDSVGRKEFLRERLGSPGISADEFVQLFLDPPLYQTDYAAGCGTLYTVVYRPETGRADFIWPGYRASQGFETFAPSEVVVPYRQAGATPR